MNAAAIVLLTALYLGTLFLVAQWGKGRGRDFVRRHSGQFYALGIAVYCTAWTFYGSIGRAATSGLDFLAIYVGPVIALPVWWWVMRKVTRIAKAQHLSSLSDFITARYGKNWALGLVVTALVLMAVTPYLALQIKAISASADLLLSDSHFARIELDLITTLLLLVFTLAYGLRFAFDPEERSGLIAAIGFESLFKLGAAFVGGWMVVRHVWGAEGQIFARATAADLSHLLTIQSPHDWSWMLVVSALAFVLLPRQFQMAVVSNQNERDFKTALWLLPFYLLLMNWWIVPIALGGELFLPAGSNPDYHFLNLALAAGGEVLPGLVFLGGLAASTSMIIVSTSALGTMVSSNFIVPAALNGPGSRGLRMSPSATRGIAVAVIFAVAFGYYTHFVQQTDLVSIGMVSFIGIAQLAPAFFGSLFWRQAHSKGVLVGLIAGGLVWATAFGLPSGSLDESTFSLIYSAFPEWSPLGNLTFLSLLLNTGLMVGISLALNQTPSERTQAEIYFNILNISRYHYDRSPLLSGHITFDRLEKMLRKFLPDEMLSETLFKRYTIARVRAESFERVPAELVSYSERLLTQVIGPVAARIVLNREIEEDSINTFDVQDILQETKATRKLNLALQEKTATLEQMTQQLTAANEQLQTMDALKDDFLYTVTHELRNPLTAIRLQVELVRDDGDMPVPVREQFLDAAIAECERLTHLITTVLDIEKFESGNQQLALAPTDLCAVADGVRKSMQAVADQAGVRVELDCPGQAVVQADEARLQQVFINLLSNAIRYASAAVTLSVKPCDAGWCAAVSDDGGGVPEQDVPHLFNKFYQSTDQTTKKRVGTGLGLAISHNIIKVHGGELVLASNPPDGPTTFSFTLPS